LLLQTHEVDYLKKNVQDNKFNVHGSVRSNNILVYKSQHDARHRVYLTTALHVSGVTIIHI